MYLKVIEKAVSVKELLQELQSDKDFCNRELSKIKEELESNDFIAFGEFDRKNAEITKYKGMITVLDKYINKLKNL